MRRQLARCLCRGTLARYAWYLALSMISVSGLLFIQYSQELQRVLNEIPDLAQHSSAKQSQLNVNPHEGEVFNKPIPRPANIYSPAAHRIIVNEDQWIQDIEANVAKKADSVNKVQALVAKESVQQIGVQGAGENIANEENNTSYIKVNTEAMLEAVKPGELVKKNDDGKEVHVDDVQQKPVDDVNQPDKSQGDAKNSSVSRLVNGGSFGICTQTTQPDQNSITKLHGVWQICDEPDETLKIGNNRIFISHAIFLHHADLMVHMHVVTTFSTNRRKLTRSRAHYCYFWLDSNTAHVTLATEELQQVYQNSGIINGTFYTPYLYKCPLPSIINKSTFGNNKEEQWPLYKYISLTTEQCGAVTNVVPITYPSTQYKILDAEIPIKLPHQFGLCVPIVYGHMHDKDINLLIEWFEFQRILGFEEIHVYNGTLAADEGVQRAFDYYAKQGLLILHQIPPPVSSNMDNEREGGGKMLTLNALHHCLHSNMARFRYMAVYDFDEIIVPTFAQNYSHMIQQVEAQTPNIKSSRDSLIYQSNNYFLDYPEDVSQPEILKTMRFRRNVGVNGWRVKSFQNPRTCELISPHVCQRGPSRQVGTHFGTVHHYRKTCYSTNNPGFWSLERCADLANRTTEDLGVLRFKPQLLDRVMQAHKNIGV